jgi:ubiquinone/menaquinone biosynthesis C-methylase UbiE
VTEPYDVTETRAAYDTVSKAYAEIVDPTISETSFDAGVLDTFVAYVRKDGGGLVGDIGCGPGRVTAYLAERGLDVFGVDLSTGMIAQAMERHPTLRFEVGDMGRLPLRDGELAGVLAWYSLIHTPPARRPEVIAELARVTRRVGAYGHDVTFDGYRLPVEATSALLEEAGFEVTATVVRSAEDWERTPQAYLVARRR